MKTVDEIQAPSIILDACRSCVYHRKGHTLYPVSKLGPGGLCLEMYYALYPFCFSFVYGGDAHKYILVVRCPRHNSISCLVVKKKPDIQGVVKNIIKDFISRFKVMAKEQFDVDIVTNQAFMDCSQKKAYRFNLNGRFDYICPAAFSAIFPHIYYQIKNKRSGDKAKIVACPDHIIDMKFRCEVGAASGVSEECGCDDMSQIRLRTARSEGALDREFVIDDVVRACNFKCLTAYQALFPYYQTLRTGGHLGFYTNDKYSAIVQCPSARNKVEFLIYKDTNTGKISYKVLAVKESCPRGYVKSDEAEIKAHSDIAPHMLYLVHLYSMYVRNEGPGGAVTFCDPLTHDGSLYQISHIGTGGR